MTDIKEQEKPEADIVRDEKRYFDSVCIKEEIFESISHQGFAAAWNRVRLIGQQQALMERIRRNRVILAWARR